MCTILIPTSGRSHSLSLALDIVLFALTVVTMAGSIDSKAAILVAVTAATSAAATYLIVKRQFESKAVAARKKQYEIDQSVLLEEKRARKEEGLPSGIKLE